MCHYQPTMQSFGGSDVERSSKLSFKGTGFKQLNLWLLFFFHVHMEPFAPATLSIKLKNTVHHIIPELSNIPGSKGEQMSP